ncbi:MAG: hypothetical protein ACE5OT_01995 [Candidatus Hadarchaeaceae archaeon]
MILPILGWALIVVGVLSMFIDLIFLEKKTVGETLIVMQLFLPKKPLGRVGNVMVIIGAIILVYSYIFL